MTKLDLAKQIKEELVRTRRHFHAYPELSFNEHNTAAFACRQLDGLGFRVRTGIAGPGLVADLGAGKTVAIRCDMDALPISEISQEEYVSTVPGVMHACGHDAHLACVLGAARLLADNPPPGKVRIIFQPGEEQAHSDGRMGAAHMVDAGVLEGVSSIIGLHVDATIPTGQVGLIPGAIMPALDTFTVRISCQSSDLTPRHPALISARVINALYEQSERFSTSAEPVILTIGAMHSKGQNMDVGAEIVELTGALKTFTSEKRALVTDAIKEVCRQENLTGEIVFESLNPAVVNDAEICSVMQRSAKALIGDNVLAVKRRTWTVDFSLYSQVLPAAFMFLGVEIPHSPRSHHSANFDIDENALPIGAAILAETVHNLLSRSES